MAKSYYALLNKAHRAETSQALTDHQDRKLRTPTSSETNHHQEPLFTDLLFKEYQDPKSAVQVLAELHRDLCSRGLITEELFEDIRVLRTSADLEKHLESLIAEHDLDAHQATTVVGNVPYVLDDDLQPVYKGDFKATQIQARLGTPGHFVSLR